MMIKLKKNERLFFIGDVHGNYNELMKVIKEKNVQKNDYLLFLGDVINKGKDSLKVLNYIRKRKNTFVVLGNHEAALIDYFINKEKRYKEFLENNGGKWALNLDKELIIDHANWLKENSRMFFEVHYKNKKIGAVHASVPCEDWNILVEECESLKKEVLWSFLRYNIATKLSHDDVEEIENIDGVIFGHVPVKTVTKVKNTLYIDTGSFWIDFENKKKGTLSVLEINEVLDLLKGD